MRNNNNFINICFSNNTFNQPYTNENTQGKFIEL
jgi:hypothetical protein